MAGTQYQGVGIKQTVLGEGHALNLKKDFPDMDYVVTWLHPRIKIEPEMYARVMSNAFNVLYKSTQTETNAETFQVKITYRVRRIKF